MTGLMLASLSIDTQMLACGLAAFSAFAAVLALALPASQPARLKARLRRVAGEREDLRAQRLTDLSARDARSRLTLKPKSLAARLMERFAPQPSMAAGTLAARLRMAGLRQRWHEALFVLCRTALPLFLAAVSLALPIVLDISPARALVLASFGAGFGYALPPFVLGRLIARRQRAILRAFPDSLDLLLICVHAGMSVEAALGRVTGEISCQSVELAEELSLTMAELSYLPSRWRAYQNLGERTGIPAVKQIASALAQAERYGSSIGQALAAAARECREMRLFEAERKAAALPPKLTFPLVIFFLPVLMAIILAPAGMKAGKLWKSRPLAISKQQSEPAANEQPPKPSLPRERQ